MAEASARFVGLLGVDEPHAEAVRSTRRRRDRKLRRARGIKPKSRWHRKPVALAAGLKRGECAMWPCRKAHASALSRILSYHFNGTGRVLRTFWFRDVLFIFCLCAGPE